MALFSEDEKSSIERAVERAEARTRGELVVVVAEASDDYAARRALLAGGLTITIAAELLWQVPELSTWLVFLLQLPIALGLHFVLGLGPLLRVLVPDAIQGDRVLARARRALVEHGVLRTEERSGILILLSVREHRVVILADEGIHARVAEGEWSRHVADIVTALRGGRAAAGLVEVIDRLGDLLAEKFPALGTPNELPNEVREV